MQSSEILRTEVSHYLILAEELSAKFADIDEDTLADTLEGISHLPDLISEIVRSSLEDEVLVDALKQRVDDMHARLARLKERYEKKRGMAAWAMSSADIHRLQAPDFSLSLRPGSQRLEICDETRLPAQYLVPQPPRIDRAGLSSLLKRGEAVEAPTELALWYAQNMAQIAKLRDEQPGLTSRKGEHYADILERLIVERLSVVPTSECDRNNSAPPSAEGLPPSKIALGPRIDKAILQIATPRRFRDKAHLRTVAGEPCLICGTVPCHAHHLKFAQPHGLAQKVSDEFVVPLCAAHHDELHRAGAELSWWHDKGVDPLSIAKAMWTRSREGNSISVTPSLSATADSLVPSRTF